MQGLDLNKRSDAYLLNRIDSLPDEIEVFTPVEFNEEHRYLPQSVSRFSGYIRYTLTPFWKEPLDCFDMSSPVREVYIKKGVQIAYTTALESVLFYVAGQVRTVPVMYATADMGLATARMTNYIIPMFQQSGMDIFQSSDVENSRKQGITKAQLQWIGGGYCIPYGALNADKMRQFSIMYMLMDEVDAWKELLAGGGDPIRLFKDRCAAFWPVRKIFIGSTPLIKGSSHIDKQFQRGDQREYMCRCLKCGFPQDLRWSRKNENTGRDAGMKWDYMEGSKEELDPNSVRYECANCEHPHQEFDKPKFINEKNCFWDPKATPREPFIQSYHMPSLLSPAGMQPWSKAVALWLEAMDPITRRVRDVGALQIFYNNVLGDSFEVMGAKITFVAASSHRRLFYKKEEIPNRIISQHCDSEVLFLTTTVDVHKNTLFVSVWGWTAGMTCWLIDYFQIHDDSETGCEQLNSPAWESLETFIDTKIYTSDNGREYRFPITLIDAGYSASTVTDFCAKYEVGVYPIVGRQTNSKRQTIREFAPFRTQVGTQAYRITVDHYKDRIAPVIRREWTPAAGRQKAYTFNCPIDTTDAELKELTREYRREKKSVDGSTYHYWHRPHGADNELWDLIVYAHAAVEILAWKICVDYYGEENVNWDRFWDYFQGDAA